ncbi:MAG: hypothetical protein JNM86_14315 [Phycisphaerae bacterium]|nr:hypothetical protein [Phycisphaerae bacterium]
MTRPDNTNKSASAPTKPAKRRARRVFIALAWIIGLGVGTYYALTQGFLGRWIIESVLSNRVGAIASLDGIHIHKSGRTDLYGLKFRVPNIPGKPGTFFEARRLEVDLDTKNWMRGEINLQAVAAEGIIARISQDTQSDSVNIQSWRPPAGRGGVGRLPRVVVRSGTIEFCENTGKDLTILKSFQVRGEVAPDAVDTDAVNINFKEIRTLPDRTEQLGMAVGGKINPYGIELVLTNVSLGDWPVESVPTRFRPIFTQLALSGEISRTRLQYSFREQSNGATEDPINGFAATLEFNNLGVSLPGISEQQPIVARIPTRSVSPSDPLRLMRVEADRGTITFASGRTEARLGGNIEGIPYTVQAIYRGTTAQSPFEAVFSLGEFDLKRDSPILRFATPLVLERLADFSYPTGKVKGQIVLSRTAGGDIQYRGEVRMREGIAAFHRFPYEFQNLRALVSFTRDEVVIHRVEGDAQNGASIVAEGRISPPNDDAAVLVKVRAENVPIDHKVEEAMGPKRSKLIRRIFNRDRYDELLARGDIRRPSAEAHPTPSTPSEHGESDEPPAFQLGGVASIDVTVTRDLGPGLDPWHDTVIVDILKAGLLPEKFPFPLVGENVRAIITDGLVHLEKIKLRGLHGGTVEVTADLDASRRPDEMPDPDPTIRIEAHDFAIDRLLVQALPDKDTNGRSARSVVSALGLTGSIDALAIISPNAKQDLGVRVEITPRTLEAVPRLKAFGARPEDAPISGEVVLRDLSGKIIVDDDLLELDLVGSASRDSYVLHADGPPPGSAFALVAKADLTPSGVSTATFRAEQFDLSLPLESVLAIVTPSTAATLGELRETYRPFGSLDLKVQAKITPERTDSIIELESITSAHITLPSIPGAADSVDVALAESTGSMRIRPGDGGLPTSVEFNDFRASVLSAGAPDGVVSASGTGALLRGALAHPAEGPSSLKFQWNNAELGSQLCRWIGATVLGELAGDLHERHDPQGPFDLTLRVLPGGKAPEMLGEFRPRALRLTMSDGVIDFPHIEGVARFDRRSVAFDKAVLGAGNWNVAVSGMWKRDDAGRSEGSAQLSLDSLGIPADLVAAAPAGICDALRDLKVKATGRVLIPTLDVRAWWDSPTGDDANGRPDRLKASGKLVIEGGSADVGVDVTDAFGSIRFEAGREGRDAPFRYDLNGAFASLRLAGVAITESAVRVVSGEKPGETFVPLLSGDCHGGRITGQASVFPTGGRRDSVDRDFDVRLALSGVTLGPLVEDLRQKLASDRPDAAEVPAPPPPGGGAAASASRSTARLDVGVSLTGTLGKPETRRGRGTASAGQGTLVSLPLVIRLVEFSNLMLPLGEPLDLLQASFFVQGKTVSFEELSIFSASVEFLGFGTLTWPNMDLDMVFTHKATHRIPIVGHVLEGLRNELVTTTVGGTLADPNFGVSSMRATRSFLSRLFGGSNDAQDRRMRELESRGQRGSDRVRVSPSAGSR